MAGSDDSGDKTEKPTPKKLQDARKKGDVSKSKDITSTAGMLAILLLAAVALPVVAEQIAALLRASFEVMQEPFELAMPRLGRQAALTLLSVVGMVVLPVALVGALVEFIQAGPVMSTEKLKPKMENMNPAKGIKRMFSMDNMVELLKSILKTAVVGTIAWLVMKKVLPDLPLLVGGRPENVGSALWHTTWTLLAWAGGAFVLVSAADLAWQRYSYTKKMRMSMRDIRQEMKDAEGDPHLKGQRKQLQQEWAQQGASNAAADAHVLVVNPTHVAIAIAYDRESCPVPTVTAKGEDNDALAMRHAAAEAGVPVLRNIELARALLADAETGDIVPAELFDLIATVVLWAQDVRHELAKSRGEAAAHAEEAARNGKPRKRREPPGEDLTRYDHAQASAAAPQEGAATRRGRFTRYVPRRWRTDPHGRAGRGDRS
ncbi:type III secretion system export apparatus subunit SctU [Ottowia testudinis]|uniref:Type III secretion system export apparatus subunit SctU n=1 Tax=Ottowia testudinis TaxID=2816950 RepID=A0A975H3P4_9BURK|nr:type III secretion system export apparatus subunit SctU [Ottowia testudinis]QTD45495.1 type III secretion system export apparatus subunit SctU [Ottowia testudinis]